MKYLFGVIAIGLLVLSWLNYSTPSEQTPAETRSVAKRVDTATLQHSETISLPLPGSAPQKDVLHTISVNEIRQGCGWQNCIPSVDSPEFFSVSEAEAVLPAASIGIALSYKGEDRFYPFPMLETHELVNDVVAGDPLLVSYCPLCGTGIVFDRAIDGEAVEFGVSGMLWQSNLLMYNRAEELADRNLWSQVLGQAVVGQRAGQKLLVISSDIMRFSDWADKNPGGKVLTTGKPRDPYNGNYLRTAFMFRPDYDPEGSPVAADAYVYGLELEPPIAFIKDTLPVGTTTVEVESGTLSVIKSPNGAVAFFDTSDNQLPDVEGFWFSWFAAHPDTQLWNNTNQSP